VAETIHGLSNRGSKNFVTVNCGAIPDNLIESEFFGYKKGAFTGADIDKPGYWIWPMAAPYLWMKWPSLSLTCR